MQSTSWSCLRNPLLWPWRCYWIILGAWEQVIWILRLVCLNSLSVWVLVEFMWSESIHSSAETASPFPEGRNWCIRQKSVTLTAKGKGEICLLLIRSLQKLCMTEILKIKSFNMLGEKERYILYFFHFTDCSRWVFQQIPQNMVT